ncbi:TonB-dependent receptor [Novosphingobium terrae]|uniref:TonB-dependent receptor n=1 Tax=Novosphingobium terrae TaxID=2726189 RepID=UPI0019804611|nr:TonB-dependent receptor [Novosphingobium terrae]
MTLRSYLFATTIFALVPTVAAAQAQPATSQTPPQSGAAPQSGLAEIIVTAQRQSESSQKAAVPLNVLPGSALLSSGITQVDRLSSLAPALSIEPTNTGNLVFVRGVGNFTLAPNSDPAIAFNYDGVYVGRPTSTTGVFYDLDRVEILKGPQGILYGRNATGGAINVLPAQPKLGELSAYASVGYGNYNNVQAEGAINLPVGDDGAVRLSLSRSSHDGYLSDGTSDENTWAGRFQVKAKLTPDLTVRVAADFAHNGGLGSGIDYQGVYAGSGANFTPSGIPAGTGVYAPSGQSYLTGMTYAPLGNHLPALPAPYQDNMFYGVNAEITYNTGVGTLTVIPAWRNSHLNYMASAGSIPYSNVETDNQYSFEARFAGKRIGPVDYQLGFYYYNERIDARTALTNGNVGNYEQPTYKTSSYAGFGRVTLHVSDRLRLVGGMRYTQDDKRFSTNQITSIISCLVTVAGRPSCPAAPTVPLFTDPSQLGYAFPATSPGALPIFVNGAPTGALSIRSDTIYNNLPLNSHKPTYRGAVEFDVAPRSMAYASIETGYRSGGFSVATGFETYQPETITAYTIGVKNRFFGNRLQLNVEGFIWDYKNQQVTHLGVDLASQLAFFTQNIGSSRIKGVEVDGKLLITPTTLVGTDIQYLDAKQKNFTYLQGAGTPPITGCGVTTGSGVNPYLINCSGLPAYNSPKWTLNFSGQQTIKLSDYKVVLSADTQYRSSRYIGFAYLAQQLVGPTWTTNAQIQFGPSNDRWSIAGYVRNIENQRIPVYSTQGGTAGLLVEGTSAPRTYGVRLTAKY